MPAPAAARRHLSWNPGFATPPSRCAAPGPEGMAPPRRGHRPRLRLGPAARPHRSGDAGLAHRRRRRHRDDRLPQPGRLAVHVQVPVGAADGPFRAAVARAAPQLARPHAARARRRAVLDGGDTPQHGARRVRPARRSGRLALGLAGRRRRRLSNRPAAVGRTRHGLVAQRARLPAGDDPFRRHRLHLGRCPPRRRLDLVRGVPGDGIADDRRRGVLGAAVAPPRWCREAVERRPQRRAGLPRGRRCRRGRLCRHALCVRAVVAVAARAVGSPARARRCRRPGAGPTSSPSSPASP